MPSRPPVAVSALVAVSTLVLVGCSSSGGSGATSAPPSGTAPSTGSAQAVALAATLRTATAALTSAHIAVDAGTLGGASSGDVAFDAGRATASDITLSLGGRTRVVTVGDTSYAALSGGRNTSGKPWVVVGGDSKNEFVRALVPQVNLIKAASSIPAVADVVASAKSVQDKGVDATGHRYALQLDTDAIRSSTLGAQLADLGTNPLPVDLYLDPKRRPVLIVISARLGSTPLPIKVSVSKFDAPVTITAPAASQVAA